MRVFGRAHVVVAVAVGVVVVSATTVVGAGNAVRDTIDVAE
ncbi:hypothetical protein [Embleya scabrispora]|nr:hypothetical protein [Embleya scabrispora]